MPSSIGVEALRLALKDAELKQLELEGLARNSNAVDSVVNLTHQQTVLISSITELFNRTY
jgi:hypothetical protein